jgi:hypothetical protein
MDLPSGTVTFLFSDGSRVMRDGPSPRVMVLDNPRPALAAVVTKFVASVMGAKRLRQVTDLLRPDLTQCAT